MIKQVIAVVLALGTLAASPSFADSEIVVNMNGMPLQNSQGAIIVDNRTLVPMRSIFEAFDFSLEWDAETKAVEAARGSFKVSLNVDSHAALVNSYEKWLDVVPVIVDGRTFVPVRFVAESLGAEVEYDPSNQQVQITTKSLDAPVVLQDAALRSLIKPESPERITVRDVYYLTKLDVSSSGVKRLDGIQAMKNLSDLNISQTGISDLGPLKDAASLDTLNCSKTAVRDLSPLRSLKKLKNLDVSFNEIRSLLPLQEMKSLEVLKVYSNPISDYSSLYYLKNSLKEIDIDRSKIEEPKYSTKYLRSTASFSVPITRSIKWVSANTVGGTSITNQAMRQVLKEVPRSKAAQIDSLYEALQLFQTNEKLIGNQVKADVRRGGVVWSCYQGGEASLRTNQAGQVSHALTLHYLLQGDYVQDGYLMFLKADGSFDLLNFMRSDRTETVKNEDDEDEEVTIQDYYIVDASAYAEGASEKPVVETGNLDDYNLSLGVFKNVHLSQSMKDFSDFYVQKKPDVVAVYQIDASSFAQGSFAVGTKAEAYVFFPEEMSLGLKTLYTAEGFKKTIEYRTLDDSVIQLPIIKDFDYLTN